MSPDATAESSHYLYTDAPEIAAEAILSLVSETRAKMPGRR